MTWTNITNAQLAIGAPIRSIDLLALRDNITAQANGDAGAPQQQTAGIADNAVTAQKVKYGAGLTASGDTLVAGSSIANGIGSHILGVMNSVTSTTFGGNYAAGEGLNQISVFYNGSETVTIGGNPISGTWKWLGRTTDGGGGGYNAGMAICVRVA